jgi:hypothetical protein
MVGMAAETRSVPDPTLAYFFLIKRIPLLPAVCDNSQYIQLDEAEADWRPIVLYVEATVHIALSVLSWNF